MQWCPLIVIIANSQPACNCPDADFRRARAAQSLGARARRRAGREHVVHQNNFLIVEPDAFAHGKRTAHVRRALRAREYLKRWMASSTTVLATTAERAELKCSFISRQFVHSKVVVRSPSNGRPQRSQNGGRMKRTCDQHCGQTSPSRATDWSVRNAGRK